LEYAEILKTSMNEFDSMLHDKYLFYYYNSLMINYSKKDIPKAIEILHEAKENKVIRKLTVYEVFIYLNLAVLNFDIHNYREALKNIVRTSLSDSFNNLDAVFRFKMAITEILIRYELNDFDFIEHKTKRIQKDFPQIYNDPVYERDRTMMEIIIEMTETPSLKSNKKLIEKIKGKILSQNSEGDIINYNDWLTSKV